jgi:23S rRNA pseudouridine1911/1915/1917 synthase
MQPNGDRVTLHYQETRPQRLDKFLVINLPNFSRSRLQSFIKDGLVLVNGEPARKAGQMLEVEDLVEVRIPPIVSSELVPEAIPLDVIFENEDLLVVNKPAGMVVHPAAGHASGTLVHAALAHAPDIEGVGGEERPGVVHRLDKDTSGLILLAKNDQAHRWLQDQFRLRRANKTYLALVDGRPPTRRGRVEAPIGRDPNQRKKMAVVSPNKGRQAVSEYQVLEAFPEHTFLEVRPITGRTHQIRLHMAFLGCPIVGDTIYGRRHASLPIHRHLLHAFHLEIQLPGEDHMRTFEAPLPDELNDLLEKLRRQEGPT